MKNCQFLQVCLKLSPFFILTFFACQQNPDLAYLPKNPDFNFHIRPILSNNCFLCHGPDSSSREANLRLDIPEGAFAKMESGESAIVPGNPNLSELIKRVSNHDPEERMPPEETNKILSEREIELLKRWIENGAEWKPYWAFIPPQKSAIPKVEDQEGLSNEIDNFILDKLAQQQLSPAPLANKRSLIRRLSYLLIGLPPSPQEINDFIKNEAPNAYEKLVDRLLDSPHFGERWARHWMDLVRYAETRGHEFDYAIIGAWRYRDYLIRAFNEDVPYDELIREHLAGDLVESPRYDPETGRNESRIGTAFFCLSEGTHSPVDIRKDEADRIDNMIDVTCKTFQGLTVACARCHDHKFDPIPTTDYYSMYGIMESSRFTLHPMGNALQTLEVMDSIHAHKTAIREFIAGAEVEKKANKILIGNKDASYKKDISASKIIGILADFRDGTLNGWLAQGLAFQNAMGNLIFDESHKKVIAFETGKASSKTLSKGLQGALRSPTFTIESDKLMIRASGASSMIKIVIDNFQLIRNPIYGGLEKILYEEDFKNYVFDLSMWKGHKAYIELVNGREVKLNGRNEQFEISRDAWMEVEYAIAYDSIRPEIPPIAFENKNWNRKEVWNNWLNEQSSPEEIAFLNKLGKEGSVRKLNSLMQKKQDQIEALGHSLYDSTFVVGIGEGDAIFSSVFERGSYQNLSKETIPHQFFAAMPEVAGEFPKTGSGRLAFANAIANPDNPLTARVMSNRVWHHLFGKGLVETVDNFGLQGKIPSHPELLDHLAIKFMEEDWSIKKLIKYIVCSNTFKRSTIALEKGDIKDPQNIYLHHFPVQRLEAETIRDALLATSSCLNTEQFGPSVPIHLTAFMKGRGRPAQEGPLDGEGRRSIYQEVLRNFLSPMMLTFDMPAPFSTFGKRNVSNVPAQSLTLMNDPFVVEQADYWALQLINSDLNFEDRIQEIYVKTFARLPDKEEIKAAYLFFEQQAAIYQIEEDNWQKNELLWRDFCHAIFNVKEFIFLI